MQGVHAAIITPFDAQLEIDEAALAAQVTRLIDDGIHGIVVNGTVGEGGSLSQSERRATIEASVAAAAGRAPVCAGVSAGTAAHACAFAHDAEQALRVLPESPVRSSLTDAIAYVMERRS